jgi:hypothetical protein
VRTGLSHELAPGQERQELICLTVDFEIGIGRIVGGWPRPNHHRLSGREHAENLAHEVVNRCITLCGEQQPSSGLIFEAAPN